MAPKFSNFRIFEQEFSFSLRTIKSIFRYRINGPPCFLSDSTFGQTLSTMARLYKQLLSDTSAKVKNTYSNEGFHLD